MVLQVLISLLFFLNAEAARFPQPLTPDESTPGHLCSEQDQDFVEHRYRESIPYCKRGVSSSERRIVYQAYRIPEHCRTEYTIDHYYPLSLGGSNHRENLWPEHHAIKKSRQNLETRLFSQIRDGEISQEQALHEVNHYKQNPEIQKIPAGNYCEPVKFSQISDFE